MDGGDDDDDADRAPWARFGGAMPPDEAYSRVSDPDRYIPLHAVAEDLVADLVAAFAVEVVPVEVDGHWRGGVLRAIELRPTGGGAPLTVITTGFGVVVRAGHAWERGFPVCGCDACDELPRELAADLAEVVHAVATGGLAEARDPRRRGGDGVRSSLATPTGSSSSEGRLTEPSDRRRAIPPGTTTWDAWPRR